MFNRIGLCIHLKYVLQANGNRLLFVLILTLEHGDCKCEQQQKERKINSMTNEKTIELTNSKLEVVENVWDILRRKHLCLLGFQMLKCMMCFWSAGKQIKRSEIPTSEGSSIPPISGYRLKIGNQLSLNHTTVILQCLCVRMTSWGPIDNDNNWKVRWKREHLNMLTVAPCYHKNNQVCFCI